MSTRTAAFAALTIACASASVPAAAAPYPISYRSIVPRKTEADNLLVPVALSASHIAYGSIRMEPVFMVLGQSAATAAALTLDGRTTLHALPYARLRRRLVANGQVLDWNES